MSQAAGIFRINNGEAEFALFTEVLQSFDDAVAFCIGLGTDSSLARISSQGEFDLVEELMEKSQTTSRIWIGELLGICLWQCYFV